MAYANADAVAQNRKWLKYERLLIRQRKKTDDGVITTSSIATLAL
jgi:hypothetical protein